VENYIEDLQTCFLEEMEQEKKALFSYTDSLDALGAQPSVEKNLEKLYTCFLDEVEEKVHFFP
jgi:hypothetical protein